MSDEAVEAMEPITLFARLQDPSGVARRLREIAQGVEIKGPDDSWESAVVSFGEGADTRSLTLTHDPAYYSEPDWSVQMSGMRGYLSRFPETDRKARALMLTTSFRFELGTLFQPDFDSDDDPRLGVLFAIAEFLDGVLFTPSSLRDARGRILFGSAGEEEESPDAEWPRVVGEVSVTEPLGAAMHESSRPKAAEDDDEEGMAPPSAERVARRALTLMAVTVRAVVEQDAQRNDPRTGETYRDLLAWVQGTAIGDELEPEEWEVIQRPPGRLEPRQQITSTWRLEGLVVLAWALGRTNIPSHDQLVGMHGLWKSLGRLDVKAGRKLLAKPALRRREEIKALRNRLFAIHWRLRNYRLHPGVMDFAEYARTCWFGPLDLTGFRLVKKDLGRLRGKRIDEAPPDVFSQAHSTAQERHQAANWLWEGPGRYSEASVST